jgi:hypothetical protein
MPLGLAAFGARPVQRGEKIGILALEVAEPLCLLRPSEVRLGRLGKAQEKLAVSRADLRAFAALRQPVPPVQPHRLLHAVTRVDIGAVRDHKRLVDQLRQRVEDLLARQTLPRAHVLDRGQRESASEHRQATEEHLFRCRQGIVAPVQSGPQGPVPRDGGSAPRRQEPEHVVETEQDLIERQHVRARRCQLDGKRHSVDPGADARDRSGVLRGQNKLARHRRGAGNEETNRLASSQILEVRAFRVGQRQRRDEQWNLPPNAQRLSAGRQDAQQWARLQQGFGQLRAGGEKVLTVVEHQQQAPSRQALDHGHRQGMPGLLAYAQGQRDGLRHQVRIPKGVQLHQPCPIREGVDRLGGDLESKSALAAAPRAGQRHQTVRRQMARDFVDLPLPSYEARQLVRKVVWNEIEGQEPRELRSNVRVNDLKDLLRPM